MLGYLLLPMGTATAQARLRTPRATSIIVRCIATVLTGMAVIANDAVSRSRHDRVGRGGEGGGGIED